MGNLQQRKSRAVFETTNAVWQRHREHPIIVELKPEYMTLRLKGTRRVEIISYTSALNLAIRNRIFRDRMEKAKAAKVMKPRRAK